MTELEKEHEIMTVAKHLFDYEWVLVVRDAEGQPKYVKIEDETYRLPYYKDR